MAGGRKIHPRAGPRRQSLKDSALARPIEVITGCNAVTLSLDFRPHHDDFVGVKVRQGLEQGGVHDAVNRGIRANAQRKRQDGDRGKTGIFAEQPETEAKVTPNIFHARVLKLLELELFGIVQANAACHAAPEH